MGFEQAVTFVLAREGGYSSNADGADSGGETNYGISKRAYPDLDIKALTPEVAKGIYRRDYWWKCQCDALPVDLAFAVLDCAVNQGVSVAVTLLQECAPHLTADGVMGPKTLAAAKSVSVSEYLTKRALRYVYTFNFSKFGAGWLSRLFQLAKATA